ncbi:hypothetical protein BC937DRAFT_88860 [Endogone sp. FLAS-F59071]|nr:hypothetical protein BC937DRAFT_88860 [Endogone sp. FLAS-F59071]|eukprot:RUS18347.1 hypothetical protein BC937DRAFT_88860 [Endogone sp. FLAS-F59071]
MAAAHAIIDPVATLEKVRSLYDAKLYPSAKFMAGMLLSALPKLNDKNASSIESETTVIFADCLFHNCEHRRAMTYYERALQTHKTAKNGKKRLEISDIEIRVKYARCCVHLHEYALARSVLEGIPDRLKTIEILSMLANLNEEMGDIKEHPHAIEAYISLLRHGLSFEEVSEYLLISDGGWIRTYIQAQANNIAFKYDEAIEAFQELSNLFKHNVDCLLSLADANLMINNTVQAYYLYSQAGCMQVLAWWRMTQSAAPFPLNGDLGSQDRPERGGRHGQIREPDQESGEEYLGQ